MSIHFVTGKLGAGKGLVSVGRIRDYLDKGLPVATNLDINLHNMFPKHFKNQRLIRIPDLPTAEHMAILGYANKSYDEKLNGLLVFDECGTWFNARSFKDKGRKELIDWLIHARKYGWDVLFQVQDISLIDKQAREALGEHVVYCKRTDRVPIPFVSFLLKALFDYRLPVPKVHVGTVTYGIGQGAMVVDRWTYFGTRLYNCYDTKQIFSPRYPHGIHSVLPGWYTHRNHITKRTKEFYMRVTKIYFKRFKAPVACGIGLLLGIAIMMYTSPNESIASVDHQEIKQEMILKPEIPEKKLPEKSVPKIAQILEPDPVPEYEPLYDRVKLNYLKSFDKRGRASYRILWNGSLSYLDNFPHRIEINRGELYAFIPVQ